MSNTTFADNKHRIDLKLIDYPTHCHHCGKETEIVDNMPGCVDYDCSGRVYGRIMKYVERLDIKGVGEETARALVEMGAIKHPADLYEVTLDQFLRIERKGAKHFKKFQEGLKAKSEIEWYEFMGSLSIDEASVSTFQNIAKAGFGNMKAWMATGPAELAKADNVTERKAVAMSNSYLKQHINVDRMIRSGYVTFRTAEKESQDRT